MQPQQRPACLQVPRQSYSAPESRGTTPMPMRPASQLGLVTYGGRPRVPRFNAPGLDLKLTREPGVWARVQWRVGLPLLIFGPIAAQLFLDFCAVYTAVQAAAEPTFGQVSSRRNWSLAAAAYCASVLAWIVGVVIIYEVVYLFWRRWRVKRPPITPIYLSTPARHLASLVSYDVYCFFRYVRRTAWDPEVYYDDRVMGREGAEGRAGNRSKEMLGAHSRDRSGDMSMSVGQSREMLSERERQGDHRRSDSGGMLMQPRESEDWKSGRRGSGDQLRRMSGDQLGRASTVDGGRDEDVRATGVAGEGIRRRSVGRNGGDEVRLLFNPDKEPQPRSASGGSGSGDEAKGKRSTSGGHRRSASGSGQTRFQELVHGPSHPSQPSTAHKFAHKRSMSGRTSAEVERALEITPVQSRRIPSGTSSVASSVGKVLGWVMSVFRRGQRGGDRRRGEKREGGSSPSTPTRRDGGRSIWSTDGFAEWCYARSQSGPEAVTLLPRAGIAGALLFAFWSPQSGAGVGSGVNMRDGAFFRGNGALTGFARGVLLANVAWSVARVLLVLAATLGVWISSGQMCAGLCGPRYRWEEPTDADLDAWEAGSVGEKGDSFPGSATVKDKLNWEWRVAARDRVQDAYELCMVRRRGSWRAASALPAPTPLPTDPAIGRIQGVDKGKAPLRPHLDTFGSTFGAGVVKERNSDQELALSGLRDSGFGMGGFDVGSGDAGVGGVTEVAVMLTPPEPTIGPRRGALSPETFTPLVPAAGFVGGFVPPSTVAGFVPPLPGFVTTPAATDATSAGRSTTPTATIGLVPPIAPATASGPVTLLPFPLQPQPASLPFPVQPMGPVLPSPLVAAVREGTASSAGRSTPPGQAKSVITTSGSRSTPSGSRSGPGTSIAGSTPTGPSTSTLVPMMTPRAGTTRLESVSSQAGDSVLESEEGEEELTGEHSFIQSGERSFSQSGERSLSQSAEHSGSGDRSYDSYAENFSVGDYAYSGDGHESVRIHAPAAGSEADTSGSYSEGVDTSASLSSLGQPISSRFFPMSFSRAGGGSSGSNRNRESSSNGNRESGASHLDSPISSNNRSSTGGPRRRSSLLSESHADDSIISSHPRDDSIISQTPHSIVSQTRDSIISHGQDSLISSPSPSVRSGLIPPPPPNPNQRRRRAGTAPSIATASSQESLGVLRRRVGSHTFGPVEFGPPRGVGSDVDNVEGFEAEQEDSVGILSAPSSRKNSLVAMSQRGRRGRVGSGSGSGSQSGSGSGSGAGSGSAGSRAVSAAYSLSVSGTGSGSGSGGSVRRGSHSMHSEDEDRDHTFGIGPTMWRRSVPGSMQGREDVGPTDPLPPAPSQPAPEVSDSTPSGSTHLEASGTSDSHETATPGAPANEGHDGPRNDVTSHAIAHGSER
ncbi:hypothetical protein BDV93DRAFT_610407 [Ceratobasidium sp. AG-I]|nr:hypothetical protein BDV93DRAFT_610407 [Ceratobasidium sp. AG-I]